MKWNTLLDVIPVCVCVRVWYVVHTFKTYVPWCTPLYLLFTNEDQPVLDALHIDCCMMWVLSSEHHCCPSLSFGFFLFFRPRLGIEHQCSLATHR